MKRTKIIYWVFTILMALFILPGSVFNFLSTPQSVEVFRHLGYPDYLSPFLGVAKFLGVIAILIPGFPKIKEWAYAGLCFDLIGAAYSGFSSGDGAKALPIFIGLGIIVGSYVYHHKRLKEQSIA